jgi:hypothetical protein
MDNLLLTYEATAILNSIDDDYVRLEIEVFNNIIDLYCSQIKVWLPVGMSQKSISSQAPIPFVGSNRWIASSGAIVSEEAINVQSQSNQPFQTYFFDAKQGNDCIVTDKPFMLGFRVEKTKFKAFTNLSIYIQENSKKGDESTFTTKINLLNVSIKIAKPGIHYFTAVDVSGKPCNTFNRTEKIKVIWDGSLVDKYELWADGKQLLNPNEQKNTEYFFEAGKIVNDITLVLKAFGVEDEICSTLTINICDPCFQGNIGIGTNEPDNKLHIENGFVKVRIFPDNDTTHGLVGYRFEARAKNGSTHQWVMYTAPVGGGHGVTPNSFSIWDYPAEGGTYPRFTIEPGITGDLPAQIVISPKGDIRLIKNHTEGKPETWEQNILFADEVGRVSAKISAKRETWDKAPMGMSFFTGNALENISERLTIKSNGKVGIGIDPHSKCKLHVRETGSSKEGNWKGAIAAGAEIIAVILGELNEKAIIGAHNASLNAWADLSINPYDGNVSIGKDTAKAKLDVGGDIRINSNYIYLRPGDDTNHGLKYAETFAEKNINGPALFGYAGGALGTRKDDKEKIALKWNDNGNIGIGTNDPKWKLHVKDNESSEGNWRGNIAAGGNTVAVVIGEFDKTAIIGAHNADLNAWENLSVNPHGTVCIGASEPKGKLHIKGDVYIDGKIYSNFGQDKWQYIVIGKSGWLCTDITYSDKRLKKDILPLTSMLNKVLQLQGVFFKWGQEGLDKLTKKVEETIISGSGTDEDNKKLWEVEKQKIRDENSDFKKGFIAQEVEQVFPEWVKTDEDGHKTISMSELNAVLVEAIKELKAEKDSEIAALRNEIEELKKLIKK